MVAFSFLLLSVLAHLTEALFLIVSQIPIYYSKTLTILYTKTIKYTPKTLIW